MKKQENMPNQRRKCLETHFKEIEVCGLPAKEFTTIISKMIKVQENTDSQLSEIWETMHGENKNINKEKLPKRTKQNLELKNLTTKF